MRPVIRRSALRDDGQDFETGEIGFGSSGGRSATINSRQPPTDRSRNGRRRKSRRAARAARRDAVSDAISSQQRLQHLAIRTGGRSDANTHGKLLHGSEW